MWVSCNLEIWPQFAGNFGDFKNIDDGDFAEIISGPKSIHVTQTLTSRKGGRIRLRRKKVGKKFYSNPVKSRSSSRSFGDTKEIYQICKASQIINGIYLLIIYIGHYMY